MLGTCSIDMYNCAKMQVGFVSVLLLILPFAWASSEDPPVVTTSQGRIVGTTLEFSPTDPSLGRSVHAFIGIPYAEAPVGPLRFKPPVANSWSGEIQATKIRNACPQPKIPMTNITMEGPFSEDCLSLDVFVPQPAPPQSAVLVFIHGGGFILGAGIMGDMYPTPTAAVGDVIVVTLNYRLGALGFLSTNDDVARGNMALLDQRLAMTWVRDNIKAFGGDPERVTIFGESAGAVCVGLHLMSPGSGGLFRGAIVQSGDISFPGGTMTGDTTPSRAFGLGKLVGCERETSQELIDCMQKVEDVNVFVENQYEKLLAELADGSLMTFGPVVDGDFLPSTPDDLYSKDAFNDAVLMTGALSDEGMLMVMPAFPNSTDEAPFVDSATYDGIIQSILGFAYSSEPIVAEMVKLMYGNASCKDLPDCDYLESLSQAIGDVVFVCPGEKTAKAFAKAGRKVYRYYIDHVSTTTLIGKKWTKATHGDDLMYVFGLPFLTHENWTFTEEEAQLSIRIITYWANLAKTGNPNLSSLDAELTAEEKETEWPLFTLENLAYKNLSPALQNGRALKAKECLMWNEFLPKLVKIADEAKKCREANEVPTTENPNGEVEQGTCTKETCPED